MEYFVTSHKIFHMANEHSITWHGIFLNIFSCSHAHLLMSLLGSIRVLVFTLTIGTLQPYNLTTF
jgi:hypothetical protein